MQMNERDCDMMQMCKLLATLGRRKTLNTTLGRQLATDLSLLNSTSVAS
jgi:hypothetical protein